MNFNKATLIFEAWLCFILLYTMLFIEPMAGLLFLLYYAIFWDHIRMMFWRRASIISLTINGFTSILNALSAKIIDDLHQAGYIIAKKR